MDTAGERLRWARVRAGYRSARGAAQALEWPYSSYGAHENGSRAFDRDDAMRYGRRFRVDWLWLLHGDLAPGPARAALIKGHVGAGGQIQMLDPEKTPDGLEEAELPPGMEPDATALLVRGEFMLPLYDNGDVLYFDERRQGVDVAELVGLLCVVRLEAGPTLVRKVLPGPSKTAFMLWSHNTEPQYDQTVDWAAAIKWHRLAHR